VESQRRLLKLGPDEFLRNVMSKSHAAIDEWQTQMQLKSTARGRVLLYTTGLTETERELTGVECIDSVENALAHRISTSGSRPIAVIPEGPYVIPFCRGAI